METGRPLKFSSVEELQVKIDNYFVDCDADIIKTVLNKNSEIIATVSRPYTITGLAEYLKTNRQTLINYEEKAEFFDTIKNAKAKIEAAYEERALIGTSNPAVSIFTLKNNFGWKDKTETDITSQGGKIESHTTITLEIEERLKRMDKK